MAMHKDNKKLKQIILSRISYKTIHTCMQMTKDLHVTTCYYKGAKSLSLTPQQTV